ncbi:hypothetical protein [Neorhizobium sp. DT-125]|uniref:hypothetical protein n=1 Tax=Neorhizobium sp. DT-125 TaxID=3396163 RepID=UPI003F1AED04
MGKESDSNLLPEQATSAISAGHLLHPTSHFDHPRDVLMVEHIGKEEKRAILASWASDISAIESMPALRQFPGMEHAVSCDEILAAVKALDGDSQSAPARNLNALPNAQRTRRRRSQARRIGGFGLCGRWKGERHRRQFEI